MHGFARILPDLRHGDRPFGNIYASGALHVLRETLRNVGIKNASEFRCHDFRRGHALDLQLSGASLYEILDAGGWRSPAFLKYLDLEVLERDAVVQAHIDESDEDEN